MLASEIGNATASLKKMGTKKIYALLLSWTASTHANARKRRGKNAGTDKRFPEIIFFPFHNKLSSIWKWFLYYAHTNALCKSSCVYISICDQHPAHTRTRFSIGKIHSWRKKEKNTQCTHIMWYNQSDAEYENHKVFANGSKMNVDRI